MVCRLLDDSVVRLFVPHRIAMGQFLGFTRRQRRPSNWLQGALGETQ
jgi:hypothetical protein